MIAESGSAVGEIPCGAIVAEATLRIADITLRLLPGANLTGLELYSYHVPFLVRDGVPDSTLVTNLQPIPELDWGRRIFVSGGLWSLYQNGDRYTMPFISPGTGQPPYRLARLDDKFTDVELFVPPTAPTARRDVAELGAGSCVVDPLAPPLDQLIFINLLSRGRGLCFHASGVVHHGRAVAFCGTSGAGKSTMASLWEDEPVILQNDDRLVVRPDGEGYRCWGTPWYSSAGVASSISAPLAKLYFLEHSPQNRITPLTPMAAAQRLLARSFPPFYDAAGMSFTLDLVSDLCETVPCATLGFVPDEGVVDLVWRDAFGFVSSPEK